MADAQLVVHDHARDLCAQFLLGVPLAPEGMRKVAIKARLVAGPVAQAATREEALTTFNRFIDAYAAKYPKATEKLTKDSDELLAFYDFPAEHWQHLRTT
jgi:transposase-like protein